MKLTHLFIGAALLLAGAAAVTSCKNNSFSGILHSFH